MENSLTTQNFDFLINIFNDKLNGIANSIQENHETLQDVINKTRELHTDNIKILLGIINNKNTEIIKAKEASYQEKIDNLNKLHKQEIEALKSTFEQQLKERDRKIRDFENIIKTVNSLLNNGHENYFKSFLRYENGRLAVEYDLRVKSIEDFMRCQRENVFSIDNPKLNYCTKVSIIPKSIQIYVDIHYYYRSGVKLKTIDLEVGPYDTIKRVKEKIQEKNYIDILFAFNKMKLSDDQILFDCNIKNGSKIDVHVRKY